jgi:hypothetical protein
LVAQALLHGLHVGRLNSSHKGRSEGKGWRNEKLSMRSSQTEMCRETQNVLTWNINVEFVCIIVPVAKKLKSCALRTPQQQQPSRSCDQQTVMHQWKTLFECGDKSSAGEGGAVNIGEERSVEWLGINGEKVLKHGDGTCRRTHRCPGDQD